MSNVQVYHGDSREILRVLPDCSIDAVVTDPPYALVSIGKRFGADDAAPARSDGASGVYARASAGFMGRRWDTGETAFDPAFWVEVKRVLKPGGHVIASAGTRTYHRLACGIEDAGFEIRDMVAWLYGSGFPKSKDVAKAVDGVDAEDARRARALMFTAWMRSTGLTAEQINGLTGTRMASHFLSDKSQPSIATADLFDRLRPHVGVVPAWVEALVAERTVESENTKARKVVGAHAAPPQAQAWNAKFSGGSQGKAGLITEAHTAEAQAWEGYGTALKPALEPCVLARKPLAGTLARNIQAWGVGGLNIDGCRIENERAGAAFVRRAKPDRDDGYGMDRARDFEVVLGDRWPANVMHDGSDEVVAAFPRSGPDEESPARFFYSAKADDEDRLGSDHPTVKPVDLQAYLIRLICPPGGMVLDPFAGSGTTGLAALVEGRDAILIEREASHADDIRRRIAWAKGEGGLTRQEILRHDLAKDPAAAGGAGLPLFGGEAAAPGGGGAAGARVVRSATTASAASRKTETATAVGPGEVSND